jgi:cytochrome c peroxidase
MMKVLSIVAALVAIVIVLGVFELRTAKPEPLGGFVAPFVFGRFQLPADNPLTQEAFELGRRLFYDPRLSIDNTVSC